MIATALSDAELLTAAREGDGSAFTELYARHHAAARRLAVSYRRAGDPDDLVNEAFERVLGALQRGAGPTDSFRAYLFVTLRRLAIELIDRDRTDPYDDVPEPVSDEEQAPVMAAAERAIVLQAYESLPDRWQAVLWQTTVEGRNPKDLAPTLGVTANAAAALAYRAREKLRQAYLQAHLQASPHPECEPHRSQLGAYVRDGLSARDQGKVQAHLAGCGSCRDLEAELLGINSMLNRALLPFFLVSATEVAAVAAGTGAGLVGGPLGLARKGVSKARNNPGPTVVAAALAVALVAGLIAANRPGGEDPPDAAAGPVEEVAPPADQPPSDPAPDTPPDEPPPEPDEPEPDPPPDAPEETPPPATPSPTEAPPEPAPTEPTASPLQEPAPTDPPATEPDLPPTEPPPAEPEPTEPPPPSPPPPSGQVVWIAGSQAVEITLHNPGPSPTGVVLMQISVSGGAVMSSGPAGCAGVPLLVLTECVVPSIPPGGTAVVSQPVAGSGPGRHATVGCTLGALGIGCDSAIPSSTIEMN